VIHSNQWLRESKEHPFLLQFILDFALLVMYVLLQNLCTKRETLKMKKCMWSEFSEKDAFVHSNTHTHTFKKRKLQANSIISCQSNHKLSRASPQLRHNLFSFTSLIHSFSFGESLSSACDSLSPTHTYTNSSLIHMYKHMTSKYEAECTREYTYKQ